MKIGYFYDDFQSLEVHSGTGVQCDGYNNEPCSCCGLRCGHLDSIREDGTFKYITLSPDAIDEEYGYREVHYCLACAEVEKKLLLDRVKEIDDALKEVKCKP